MMEEPKVFEKTRDEYIKGERKRLEAALENIEQKAGQEFDHYVQLQKAFDLVKDKEHWKNPIDAIIPADSDLALIEEAINYYAGGGVKFYKIPKNKTQVRVTAPGYWKNGF